MSRPSTRERERSRLFTIPNNCEGEQLTVQRPTEINVKLAVLFLSRNKTNCCKFVEFLSYQRLNGKLILRFFRIWVVSFDRDECRKKVLYFGDIPYPTQQIANR